MFGRARVLSRRTGSQRFEGIALQHLGSVHRRLKQYEEALDHARQALVVFQKIDYRHGQAETLQLLGDIQSDTGRLDDARGHWEIALAIIEEVDALGPLKHELRVRLDLPV